METIIKDAIDLVENLFINEYSGHDVSHTMRVYKLATKIAIEENADLLSVQLASLLHDVDDHKLSPATYPTKQRARDFLSHYEVDVEKIISIIETVSFMSDDSMIPTTLEGKIVQDADRLDAIGAIGIARCFTYGGHKDRILYDVNILPTFHMTKEEYQNHISTTLNHFYEKLLLLKDLMNTNTAKQIALARHQYMEDFLEEFLEEWNGRR